MGLPGSGKTSLCRGLSKRLRKIKSIYTTEKAIDICIKRKKSGCLKSIFKRFPRVLREPVIGVSTALHEYHLFASEHIGLCHQVFEVLDRENCKMEKCSLVTYAFIHQAIQYQLLKQHIHSSECVLVEEGFGQRGFTLFGYLSKKDKIEGDEERYVSNIPLPDILIWVKVDSFNAMRRLFKRNEIPLLLRNMTQKEILSKFEQGIESLKNISELMNKRGTHVLYVSNMDGEFQRASDIIKREVMKLYLGLPEGKEKH